MRKYGIFLYYVSLKLKVKIYVNNITIFPNCPINKCLQVYQFRSF